MRNRTPKTLGTRHEPGYLHRRTRFALWRRWLVWGIPIVALLTLLAAAPYKDRRVIYSKGPVASAHAFIAEKCEFCHGEGENNPKPVGFFKKLLRGPTDEACLACHEAPVHHKGNQPPAPACASCHVEHQGHDALFRLSHAPDRACINCHGNLDDAVKKAKVQLVVDVHPPEARYIQKFNGVIPGVDGSHPEFKAASDRWDIIHDKAAPLNIVFHHATHVGPQLMVNSGTTEEQVTLQCVDCHRPVVAKEDGAWKYRLIESSVKSNPAQPKPEKQEMPDPNQRLHPDAGREIMSMPTYETNCAGCHNLLFDCSKGPVVHPKIILKGGVRYEDSLKDELVKVHNSVVNSYQGKGDSQRFTIQSAEPACSPLSRSLCTKGSCPVYPSRPRIPEKMESTNLAKENIDRAEKYLNLKCTFCHESDPNSLLSRLPELANLSIVKPIGMQPRQMPHSIFSHEAHMGFTCGSCHGDLPVSCCQEKPLKRGVPDVRLPLITTCESCHNGNPSHAGNAENSCFLCHQYHKWNERDDLKHPPANYTLQQLGLPGS